MLYSNIINQTTLNNAFVSKIEDNISLGNFSITCYNPSITLTNTNDNIYIRITSYSNLARIEANANIYTSRLMQIDGGVQVGTNAIITSAGKIGVHTTSPTQDVDIVGNLRVTGQFRSNSSYMGFYTDSSSALPVKVGSLVVSASYADTAPANGAYISGNVGIGIVPTEKLDINGDVKIRGTGSTIGHTTVANGSLIIGNTLGLDPNEIFFSTEGYIGTTNASVLNICTNATRRIRVMSDGKIAVNKDTPTADVDIQGSMAISGTVDGIDISAHNHNGTGANGTKISYTDLINKPVVTRQIYTATANIADGTAITLPGSMSYTQGQLLVFVNGRKQIRDTTSTAKDYDYWETSSTQVTFNYDIPVNAIIEFIAINI